jgi:translation initiation factor 3 subunit B
LVLVSSDHSSFLAAAFSCYLCRRYDEEDEQLLLQADADVLQERQKQQEEWDAAAAAREEYVAAARSFYEATFGERAKEKPYSMTSVAVEQILDVREEPYNVAN